MAQKYIIGDLIKYKVGGLEFIAEITNTSKYGYCFKGVSDDISGTLCKEFANDIPLTPEILEKNGWKHKKEFGEYWFIPRNEDYELLALDKVGEEWAIYIEENCSNFEYIKFVHQLQHLLFGLGINHEMEV